MSYQSISPQFLSVSPLSDTLSDVLSDGRKASIRMNKKQLKFIFLMNPNLLGNIFCFKYRHASFVLCIIVLCRYGVFYKLRATLQQAHLSALFSNSIAHSSCLCVSLVILTIFQTFSLLSLHFLW